MFFKTNPTQSGQLLTEGL